MNHAEDDDHEHDNYHNNKDILNDEEDDKDDILMPLPFPKKMTVERFVDILHSTGENYDAQEIVAKLNPSLSGSITFSNIARFHEPITPPTPITDTFINEGMVYLDEL